MKTLLAIISLFLGAAVLAYVADALDITTTVSYFLALLVIVVGILNFKGEL